MVPPFVRHSTHSTPVHVNLTRSAATPASPVRHTTGSASTAAFIATGASQTKRHLLTYVNLDAVLLEVLLSLRRVGRLVSEELFAVFVPLGGVEFFSFEIVQTCQVSVIASANMARDVHFVEF